MVLDLSWTCLGLDIGGLDYIPIPLDCCNVLTNQL